MDLSAYTVRKIAPKLLVAVIGVNLSIYLCVGAIDITNIIGGGLGDLIRSPFLQTDSFNSLKIDKNAVNGIVGVVGNGALVAVIGVFGFLAITEILATLLLFFVVLASVSLIALAVLATLVIRYGAIIFLTIISPIAIACWVLPGTEKYFRQWWSIFLKTLVVYPIIAVIFAISDVLGAIFLSAQSSNNNFSGMIAVFVTLFVLYAPLFMIPFSFKLAGGIIGSVYNLAQERGVNPLQGRLNKWKEDPESFYARSKTRKQQQKYGRGLTAKQVFSGGFAGTGALLRGKGLSGFRTRYGAVSREIGAKKANRFEKEAKEREFFDFFHGDNDVGQALLDTIASGDFSDEAIGTNLMNQDNMRFGGRVDEHGNLIPDNQDQIDQRNQYISLIKGIHGQLGDQVASMMAVSSIGEATTGFNRGGTVAQYLAARQAGGRNALIRQRTRSNAKEAAKRNRRIDTGFYSASNVHTPIAALEDAIQQANGDMESQIVKNALEDYRAENWASAKKKASPTEIATADSNTYVEMEEWAKKNPTQFANVFTKNITDALKNGDWEAAQIELAGFNALQQSLAYSAPEIRDSLANAIYSQEIKNDKGDVISTIPVMKPELNAAGNPVTYDEIDEFGDTVKKVKMKVIEKPANIREMMASVRSGEYSEGIKNRPSRTYQDQSSREYGSAEEYRRGGRGGTPFSP